MADLRVKYSLVPEFQHGGGKTNPVYSFCNCQGEWRRTTSTASPANEKRWQPFDRAVAVAIDGFRMLNEQFCMSEAQSRSWIDH